MMMWASSKLRLAGPGTLQRQIPFFPVIISPLGFGYITQASCSKSAPLTGVLTMSWSFCDQC